ILTSTEATTGVNYLWTKSGKKLFTSPDTIITKSSVSDGGLYVLQVSQTYPNKTCINSDTLPIVVQASPVINTFIHPYTSVCDFNATSVYIATADTGFSYYDWYLNGVKISDQHDSLLYVPIIGTYKLVVNHSENSCIASDSVTITGYAQSPTISVKGAPLDSLLISSQALSYQWYVDNKKIIGQNYQTLSIGYNGSYTVLATYPGNCKEFSQPFVVNRYDFISITRINSQTDSTILLPPTSSSVTSNLAIRYDEPSNTYYVEYTPAQDEVLTITVTAMTGEVLWKKDVKAS